MRDRGRGGRVAVSASFMRRQDHRLLDSVVLLMIVSSALTICWWTTGTYGAIGCVGDPSAFRLPSSILGGIGVKRVMPTSPAAFGTAAASSKLGVADDSSAPSPRFNARSVRTELAPLLYHLFSAAVTTPANLAQMVALVDQLVKPQIQQDYLHIIRGQVTDLVGKTFALQRVSEFGQVCPSFRAPLHAQQLRYIHVLCAMHMQ